MPGQTRRRSWFVVAMILLVALQTATPVWAGRRLGHCVMAKLDEKHLNPKAKAALLEPGELLADCSTWADEHRRQLPKTAPWHYVDISLDRLSVTVSEGTTFSARWEPLRNDCVSARWDPAELAWKPGGSALNWRVTYSHEG